MNKKNGKNGNHNHTGPIFKVKPMLVDSMLNLALAFVYFIYACFGLIGTLFNLTPPLYQMAGEVPAKLVGAMIFLSAVAALVAVLRGVSNRAWMRWEFYSTATMVTFLAAHVAALIVFAIYLDMSRLGYAVLSISLLVMPSWKLFHILKSSRN